MSYTSSIYEESLSPSSSIPLSPDSTCRVEIIEQPISKVRFRYLSELQGTPHGPLFGVHHSKMSKSFPKAQLIGYDGSDNVKMRCWIVDKDECDGTIRPHCHDLVMRRLTPYSEILLEPHTVSVSRKNNYTAVFENMVVLHCVQKECVQKYIDKEIKWISKEQVYTATHKVDKKKVRDTIKSINKNEVYLYFEAYIQYPNSIQILASALSDPVKNLKNPISGDLKICKVLNNDGPCEGGTEVALFTEKVPPEVKVKIFKGDWETYIAPEFVHRNLALTFRMPPYPKNLIVDTKVKFCLYRESDMCESNPMDFIYHPPEYEMNDCSKRKKFRVAGLELDNSPMDESIEDSNISAVLDANVNQPVTASFNCSAPVKEPPGLLKLPFNKIRLVNQDLLKKIEEEDVEIKEEIDDDMLDDLGLPKGPPEPPKGFVKLGHSEMSTIRTIQPALKILGPKKDVKDPPKKVFHVSKLKFQHYLQLMKSKGYKVKCVT